jgi:hypothetical protein
MQDPTKEEIRKAVYGYFAELDRSGRAGQFFNPHWEDKITQIVKPAMLELKTYLLELAVRSRIADKDGNDDYRAGPYIGMALYPINDDGRTSWPVISFQGSNPDVLVEVSHGSPVGGRPAATTRTLKPGQITRESVEAELKDFVANSMSSWSQQIKG